MSENARSISHEELVELQKKFSEIKYAVNSDLAVMMARAQMSQRRRPIWRRWTLHSKRLKSRAYHFEKLASTVLTKVPLIVSSLEEFMQALNEKAGPKPEVSQ